MPAYDVIGDVHGSADKLDRPARRTRVPVVDGAYRTPTRTAVFVGDLMDRGDGQVEVARVVRAMHASRVRAGWSSATMSSTPSPTPPPIPTVPGDFARTHLGRHGAHNPTCIVPTWTRWSRGSALHRSHLAWFRTLPLYLDLGGIRIAHACWHPASLAVLDKWTAPGAPLRDSFILEANTRGTEAFEAVEVVLKGPELRLPPRTGMA